MISCIFTYFLIFTTDNLGVMWYYIHYLILSKFTAGNKEVSV